ncbi:hypothetical protein KR026_002153, partial [Drosophila bipectinata]
LNRTESQMEKLQEGQAGFLNKVNEVETGLQAQLDFLQKLLLKIHLPGFTRIGSRSFYIENNLTMTWDEASSHCKKMKGNLADIESEEELTAITKVIEDKIYWIGYNDIKMEGVYISSATGKNATILKWAPGEPTNGLGSGQHCVTLFDRKHMDDDYCSKKRNFICQ